MNKKETVQVMDEFTKFDSYEDVKSFVIDYLKKANKINKKSSKKGVSDNSIKVFIENANLLKPYESTVLKKISIFHFSKNIIQYYLLNEDRLIGYFGFRTQVRNGVIPTINKFTEYLNLYLMEIVNGIYGESYDEKRVMLDKILYLSSSKKGYKEAIVEAYEILYLQYSHVLELESYQKGLSLSVFKGFKFVDKNYNNVYEPTAEHVFKEIGAYLTASYDKDDKSLLRACFDYVYYELNLDGLYELSGQTIDDIFAFECESLVNAPLNNIKALYPLSISVLFLDDDGVLHSIEKGEHSKEKYFYSYRRKMLMEYVLETLMKSLKKFCDNYDYDCNYDYKELYDCEELATLKANLFGNINPGQMQQLVDNAVERWVATDSEFLRNIYAFNHDMIDHWIKDNKFNPKMVVPRKEKKSKKQDSLKDKKELKVKNISSSDINKFIGILDELQFGTICIFIGLSQNIKPGVDTLNNIYTMEIVKQINVISLKIFGEKIIQNNKIVAKYTKMITKELVG